MSCEDYIYDAGDPAPRFLPGASGRTGVANRPTQRRRSFAGYPLDTLPCLRLALALAPPSATIWHQSVTSAALPHLLMSRQPDPHCLSLGGARCSAPDSPITPASAHHALFAASTTQRYPPSRSLLMALFSVFRRQRDIDGDATELLPTPDKIPADYSAGRHQRQPSGSTSTSYSAPESTLAPGDDGFDFETSLRNVVEK